MNENEFVGSPGSPSSLTLALSYEDESSQEFIPLGLLDYPPSPVTSNHSLEDMSNHEPMQDTSNNESLEDEDKSFTLEYLPSSPDSTRSCPTLPLDSEPKSSPTKRQRRTSFLKEPLIPFSPVAQVFSLPPIESKEEKPTEEVFNSVDSEQMESNDSQMQNVSMNEIKYSETSLEDQLQIPKSINVPSSEFDCKPEESAANYLADASSSDFGSKDQGFGKSPETFKTVAESPSSLEDGEIEESIAESVTGPPTPIAEPYPGIYGNRMNEELEEFDDTLNLAAGFSPLDSDFDLSMEEPTESSNTEPDASVKSESNPGCLESQSKNTSLHSIEKDSSLRDVSSDAWEMECIKKIDASMDDTKCRLPAIIQPFAPLITDVVSLAEVPTITMTTPLKKEIVVSPKKEVYPCHVKIEELSPVQPKFQSPGPNQVVVNPASAASLESVYFNPAIQDPREIRDTTKLSPVRGEEVYVSFVVRFLIASKFYFMSDHLNTLFIYSYRQTVSGFKAKTTRKPLLRWKRL